MPRAILDYIDSNDFNFVLVSQKNINDSYIADMAKYATPNETTKIMGAFNSIPAKAILAGNQSFDGFKGVLVESYVCSALVSNGHSLFYWETNSNAEVDFVIQDNDGNIIPIEVKYNNKLKRWQYLILPPLS